MSLDDLDKIDVLPEDYNSYDLTFKIIVIGDSGKYYNNIKQINYLFL